MATNLDLRRPSSLGAHKRDSRQVLTSATALLIYLALLKFLIHLAISTNYGFLRDELYYIDAGKHLAFGYVDFPPLIAWLAALVHVLAGNSLMAYHLIPALAGAFLVFLTGLIARELGANRFSQCLAAISSLTALTILGADTLFSMDPLDELWWVLAAYLLLRLIRRDRPRLWLLFGLVAGIGLLTKLTMLMFGFAIVVGLLLTPARKYLFTKWAWLGGAIAFAFLVPYLLWNAANGWPTLQFWSGYANGHTDPASALDFLYQQVLSMNPLTLPLWLAGLIYFFTPTGKPYRVFGWAFMILYVLFTLSHAKLYFLAPAYPPLFAAGAVLAQRLFVKRPRLNWLKPTYPALMALIALLLAPAAMPLLPPQNYGIMSFIGGDAGIKLADKATSQLPQQLADRLGWDTMTATVAQVYHSLPADEQAQACILAGNYGEAGAIDLYGPHYHLPHAVSGHNNFYLWGPGNCTGQTVIVIGNSSAELATLFESVTPVATITCAYCLPAENDLPIFISQHLKMPIQTFWAKMKHFD